MKGIINNPFIFALTLYFLAIIVFLAAFWVQVNKKPVQNTQSVIPSLSSDQLEKAFAGLSDRDKIDYSGTISGTIDLSKFNFGKPEPFNP